MCGIYGGHTALLQPSPARLLKHRGPDQSGSLDLIDCSGVPFVFGMTRLSIVNRKDIPLPFSAMGAHITFNGEIYNWREVRTRLEDAGFAFQTETDIEVALYAYLHWGPDCLSHFNGMFAFAIWDEGKVFLARDRLGKKPLFYYYDDRDFAFGSEIKVFARREFRHVPICDALEFYFDEYTPLENIHSVKPGHYLLFDTRERTVTERCWYRLEYQGADLDTLDAALKDFLPLMEDACRIRKIADAPVTMFLSGGIDSCLIQGLLKLDTAYTVQFEEFRSFIDEESLVREYAEHLGFDVRVITPTKQELLDSLPALAWHLEYPVGSFSCFPLYCLSRRVRADGYLVAIDGQGADEFFNGYFRNEMILKEDAEVEAYMAGPYRDLASVYFGSPAQRMARLISRNGLKDVSMMTGLLESCWDETRPLHYNISTIEGSVFLQPLLTQTDRMSMAHSLEVRSPFLDHRIVEFSMRLAPHLRYANGRGKYLLREALKVVLGTDTLGVTRREIKHGLPAPLNQWLFGKNRFDRKDWNRLLLRECLAQISGPAPTREIHTIPDLRTVA